MIKYEVTKVLQTQQFLRSGGTIEQLAAEPCCLDIKRRDDYSNLVHFTYNQLNSPKAHPIVLECRGLILDEADDWNVVAYPFNRFANYGEEWASPIDWNSAKTQDKLDGSMICQFYYGGKWLVSMKGNPAGRCSVGLYDLTFEELFWKTFKSQKLPLETFYPGVIYMWELTSMANRIVCEYPEPRITLIGLRDRYTLQEYPVSNRLIANVSLLPVVREYGLTSYAEVVKAAEALNPLQHEGYVVVDKDFNRVKIKSPKYVLIHHMKSGFGQRRILGLIRLGEQSEVLAHFPEYQAWYDEVNTKVNEYCQNVDQEFTAIQHIEDQRAFVEAAKKTSNFHFMMEHRKGKFKNCFDYLFLQKWNGKNSDQWRYQEWQIEKVMGLKPKELKLEE